MDCKELQKIIPLFLNNELKGKKLIQFLRHIDGCEECKEELTIQYLASEGIARLEEGKTFDLERELTEYIEMTLKKQKRKKMFRFGLFTAEIVAILIILVVLAYAFLW